MPSENIAINMNIPTDEFNKLKNLFNDIKKVLEDILQPLKDINDILSTEFKTNIDTSELQNMEQAFDGLAIILGVV